MIPDTAIPAHTHINPHTITVHYNTSSWDLPQEPLPPPDATFHQYTQHLPSWEKALLHALELIDVTEAELLQALQEPCLICSDGSQIGPKASLGWILSTYDGRRLAKCNGPAYGCKPSSYRAEGYGILSGCRFLIQFRHHHQIEEPWQLLFLCDNDSMLNKALEPQDLNRTFPNSTLDPDWDVVAEIWKAVHRLEGQHCRPTFQHIKGHQDDNTAYGRLSLKAQLNVDADRLADAYIAQNPNHPYHTVPLLPTSGGQIHLPGGTITHNFKHTLGCARTEQPLKDYLCQRHSWDEETLDTIDWLGSPQKSP